MATATILAMMILSAILVRVSYPTTIVITQRELPDVSSDWDSIDQMNRLPTSSTSPERPRSVLLLVLAIAGVVLGIATLAVKIATTPTAGTAPSVSISTVHIVGDYDHVGDEYTIQFDVFYKVGECTYTDNQIEVEIYVSGKSIYKDSHTFGGGADAKVPYIIKAESIDVGSSVITVAARLNAWQKHYFGWDFLSGDEKKLVTAASDPVSVTVQKPYDWILKGPTPPQVTHGQATKVNSTIRNFSQKTLQDYHRIRDCFYS